MKLNLGCGKQKMEGFINIDDDPNVNPDYLINLDDVNLRLPFDDDTVDEVNARHILEHIGAGFLPLMKEIYRVAKDGCIVDIVAPNEYHAVYYGDPTHVRPINSNIFRTMSKKEECGYLATKYGINFDVIDFSFNYDPMYEPLIAQHKIKALEGTLTQEEEFMLMRLMREANNVAIENVIKLKVIKNDENLSMWPTGDR